MPRKRKDRPDGFDKAFPKVLRKLMGDEPQQKLADYLGKSRQSISYYRDGTSAPDWEDIVKIADYFEVSADYLLGRVSDPPLDQNTVSVHKYTGLSTWTIDFLHCYPDEVAREFYLRLIDSIVESLLKGGELIAVPALIRNAALAAMVAKKSNENHTDCVMENIAASLGNGDGYKISAADAESFFLAKAQNKISMGIADVLRELEGALIASIEVNGINGFDDEKDNMRRNNGND